MSAGEDRKLEEMLRSRRVEPASPDLAERIILRTQSMPQNQTISPARRLKELFAEFHLPRPAYVLTGALILGVVLGFNSPVPVAREGSDALYAQAFLDTDEGVL
jgi:hypothetical protein